MNHSKSMSRSFGLVPSPLRRRGLASARSLSSTCVFLLVLFVAGAASAQGILLPRDGTMGAVSLVEHEVHFEMRDHGAVTRVTHVFRNETPRDLEAVFYFAIPRGAATTDFALWMNGQRVAGEVVPRQQARATYESIVRRMQDPGLLEWVDGDLFQASIYPVPARGNQRIEIAYASVLDQSSSTIRYAYPIHASAHTGATRLSIRGEISSAHGITSVYSPWLAVDDEIRADGRSARVDYEQSGFRDGGEFELYVTFTGDDVGFSMLTWEGDDGEPGYFMITLAAARALEQLEIQPRNITFVVDVSGSMTGPKIQQARTMLAHAVRDLGPRDTFNVITFSTRVTRLFPENRVASNANRDEALAFIERLQARGNTNISGALQEALAMGRTSALQHTVVFVTDGLPTEGIRDVEGIVSLARAAAGDGTTRIFSFGVGYDVNTRLLEGIARRGRGEAGYVRPEEDISDVVGTYLSRISAPVLTNLEFDFGSVRVTEMYPSPLPDLYRDGPVTVFGRFEATETAPIRVRGFAGEEAISLRFAPDYEGMDGSTRDFVGNLWARRRIDALLDEITERGERPELLAQVTSLAMRWNIVTPYTSYLAVEPGEPLVAQRPVVPQPRPVPRHGAAPTGAGGLGRSAEASNAPAGVGAWDEDAAPRLRSSVGTRGEGQAAAAPGRAARATPTAPAASAAPSYDAMAAPMEIAEGAEAVERERARAHTLRDARRVEDRATTTTRVVAGRRFTLDGSGVWIEHGLGDRRVDERVDAMSDRYFALIEEDATLALVLSIGPRVRFAHQGRVIETR